MFHNEQEELRLKEQRKIDGIRGRAKERTIRFMRVMSKINFLKPDKQNLSIYLYSGSFLFFVAIFDVFLGSFFKIPNNELRIRTFWQV